VSETKDVIKIRTELWFAWAEIAGEQEVAARSWRRKASDDLREGRNPSENMAQETKAAIAAISASGAALETFGKNLRFFSPDPEPPRWAGPRVLSQVRHLYPSADITPELEGRVLHAFARRNETLHYSSTPEQIGPHPLGMPTTWVARSFTVEAAALSVNTVADLIDASFTPGSSHVKSAEYWAHYCRFVGKKLRNRSKVPLDIVP
jgi:hypothetical protein